MRSLRLALPALALAAVLAGAALVLWPEPQPDPGGPIPLAAAKTLGVNADLVSLAPAERDQALAAMEAAGLAWLRQRFDWAAMEPRRGRYDWPAADAVVAGAREHGLTLIAVLDGSPGWARAAADADNPLAPPVEVRDYGDWVAAFAGRYGPAVGYYQIWDEPNIAPHWGAGEIDPAAYARLLREGAIRVRAANPGAVVLAAALAPTVEPGGANMSELLFLDALYGQGAAPWFDAVAGQPYPFEEPLTAGPDAGRLGWRRLELVRQVMVDHGDVATAVWAAAFGLPPDGAAAIAPAVAQARTDWPWLGPMLWAAWSPAEAHGSYALLDAGGEPNAAYAALRDLATAPPVAWPGVYPPNHASGRYDGDWRVTGLGADPGRSGDRLTIAFQGSRLDLAVRRGDYRAFLFVTVDDRPANALPRDVGGRAYVVLYDPLHGQEPVTLACGLAPGRHQAEIVAEGGWGQWAIAGWGVADEAQRQPAWPAVMVALLSLAAVGLAAWLAWPQRAQLAAVPARFLALGNGADESRSLPLRFAPGAGVLATGLAALLFYAVPDTLPSLVLLAVVGLLLLLRPWLGLPLIALALPFYQLGKPLAGKHFSMVEILTVVTAAAWLVRSCWSQIAGSRLHASRITFHANPAKDVPRFRRPPAADLLVLALVVVAVLSLLWADNGRVAARELRTVVLEAALFYGLLRATLRRGALTWNVVDAWLLGGVLIAAIGLAQWLLGENVITAEGVWRVRGFYGSPNNLALYLGRLFPLALSLAVFPAFLKQAAVVSPDEGEGGQTDPTPLHSAPVPHLSQRTVSEGRDSVRGRGHGGLSYGEEDVGQTVSLPWVGRWWLYGLAALLMAAALFLTYSRGAWLVGVPAALLFLAALRSLSPGTVQGRRVLALALLALLLAGGALLAVAGTGRLASLLETEGGTTFFRLQLWRSSLAMIADHPVLGVGLDNFLYHYRSAYVLPTAWEELNLSHPHNLILDFWLRLGLPGLAVLVGLLVVFFRRGWWLFRRTGGAERWLVAGLMAGMVNFVAHGLVDNSFFLVDLAFAFMLMLAVIQQMSPRRQNRSCES